MNHLPQLLEGAPAGLAARDRVVFEPAATGVLGWKLGMGVVAHLVEVCAGVRRHVRRTENVRGHFYTLRREAGLGSIGHASHGSSSYLWMCLGSLGGVWTGGLGVDEAHADTALPPGQVLGPWGRTCWWRRGRW